MSTRIGEVYEAFLSADVPEDKARAASKALPDDRNASKSDIATLDKDLAVAKWRLGIIVTGVVALLIKAFIAH